MEKTVIGYLQNLCLFDVKTFVLFGIDRRKTKAKKYCKYLVERYWQKSTGSFDFKLMTNAKSIWGEISMNNSLL